MSHPSLFPTTLATKAARLNSLIDDYRAGRLDRPSFVDAINQIGLSEQAKAELLSVPVYRFESKSDELQDEFSPCVECSGIDGECFDGCLSNE